MAAHPLLIHAMVIVLHAGKLAERGCSSTRRALQGLSMAAALFLLTGIAAVGQGFVSTHPMKLARHGHVAVRLADGRILVTSGANLTPITTTEIYDPASRQWSTTGSTGLPRTYGTAVRLSDGKVLLAGGTAGPATTEGQNAAEIYDPVTGSWTVTGSTTIGDAFQTLTLLPNGKALLLGGGTFGEVYDPATGAWTATQPWSSRRERHSATLLSTGKVLIAGGRSGFENLSTCELYDPATGAFTATGSLATAPSTAPATLLASGEVLRAGGSAYVGNRLESVAGAEIYDPATGAWRVVADLGTERSSALAPLGDGRAMVSGGLRWKQGSGVYVPETQMFDLSTGAWTYSGKLAVPRDAHTATPLENGGVLIVGGIGEGGVRLSAAELYDPTAPSLSGVTLSSSRAGSPAVASPGDIVTLRFTASEPINPPKVTLLGQNLTATAGPGNTWSASATVAITSPHGPAALTIAFQNSAGFEVAPVEGTTDGSSVSIDTKTETPTNPTPTDTIVSNSFSLNFGLPEQPLPGSVKLFFREYFSGELASTIVLGASQEVLGDRTLTFNPLDPTSSEAVISGSPLIEGEYQVTLSYQDAAGNPPSVLAISGLRIDTTAPVITRASMFPAFARPGSTVTVSLWVADQDVSGVSGTISGAPVRGFLYPLSATMVVPDDMPDGHLTFSLSVTDQAGNVSLPISVAHDGIYTMIDSVAPVLTVPERITVEANHPLGAEGVRISGITATDNLDPSPSIYTHAAHGSQYYFSVGATTVNVEARDAAGNISAASVIVQVVDTTSPVASVPAALQIQADHTREATIGDLRSQVTRSDAVGVVSVIQSPEPGTVLPEGSHPVSFVVSDAAGNSTTVQTTVTITYAGISEPGITEGAHSGQNAPYGPPAGTKLSTFGTPAISDLADLATKVGMVKGRSKTSGILIEYSTGTQRLAAFEGDGVPGISGSGFTFKSFLDPVISPGGAVAFVGTMQQDGRPMAGDQGVWTDFSGALEMVLREGDDVPGTGGAKLKSVNSISLRDEGLLATITLLPGRNRVTVDSDSALVLVTGMNTGRVLLREGMPLGEDAGALIKRFSVLQPALGSAGHGRWHGDGAVLANVTIRNGEERIVKITPDGAIADLLSTSSAATAIDASARWKSFGLPAMGTGGETTVLAATLSALPGVVTEQNNAVLLAQTGSSVFAPFAREGWLIAGGQSYASFADPVVNDHGTVAFLATLRGNGVTGANRSALFAGQHGSVELIARLGQKAPDENGTLTTASWSKFITYALPSGARPGLLFVAETSGGDTTTQNRQALWAVDSQNKLRRLLRTGAQLVNGGPILKKLALLTTSRGSFGSTRSFNSTGSIAVRATFDDGSQSLLRIDVP